MEFLGFKSIGALIVGVYGFYVQVRKKWNKIKKDVEPLIRHAEELALDGEIDRADRIAWVTKAVGYFEKKGDLNLTIKYLPKFITRRLIKYAINAVAKSLPNITLTNDVKKFIIHDLEKHKK